ncbi:ABC transporter ATP-binding protein [Magnetococcus sp. PR-3]|uniref:ABC transporter ATP-binding protein n=1 Tax=Magnetococcus sp. PR-3 TaxID=3120355 RepID=UPI002FCE2CF1
MSLLHVEQLTKGFSMGQNHIEVLRGINLDVQAGETVAIMGPSGSGKTTLLNCVAGIERMDKGQIILQGEVAQHHQEQASAQLRRHTMGIIFQFFNLVPMLTVRENIALPLFIDGQDPTQHQVWINTLLSMVGMHDRANHLPAQLSGGEMQLVSIARALVMRPPLLLADEPTGNVNPATGKRILHTLKEVVEEQNCALILVTHSAEHAAWAHRVCFLHDGHIHHQLTPQTEQDFLTLIYNQLAQLGI